MDPARHRKLTPRSRAVNPMIEVLAVIDAPHFYCGIVLWDDRVAEAAPIVKYMRLRKWSRKQVRDYCVEKRWRISVVYQMQRDRLCVACAGSIEPVAC